MLVWFKPQLHKQLNMNTIIHRTSSIKSVLETYPHIKHTAILASLLVAVEFACLSVFTLITGHMPQIFSVNFLFWRLELPNGISRVWDPAIIPIAALLCWYFERRRFVRYYTGRKDRLRSSTSAEIRQVISWIFLFPAVMFGFVYYWPAILAYALCIVGECIYDLLQGDPYRAR